jgi:hypothetical protein
MLAPLQDYFKKEKEKRSFLVIKFLRGSELRWRRRIAMAIYG